MFGFGLFSTHLPYLVLIIGYVACWCWGFQAKPGTADEDESQVKRIEVTQDVRSSEKEVVTLNPFHNITLAGLPATPPPLQHYTKEKDKPQTHYPAQIITDGHRLFSFLRPPPYSLFS